MTSSKLGYFIVDSYDGIIEELIRAKPRVVKSGDPGLLHTLYDALGPDTVFIARNFGEVDDMARWDNGRVLTDPVAAAKYWVDAYRPAMKLAPNAFWESFNEMSNWGWMPAYGKFEAERQRLMNLEGYRACVGNFSTGSPPIFPDTDDPWKYFYPALDAANKYKNCLGIHEYGGLYMDMFYGPNQRETMLAGKHIEFPEEYAEGYLACRYRKVWNTHIYPNGWTDLRIVITEAGLDRAGTDVIDKLVGYPVGPWTQCQPYWATHDRKTDGAAYYASQLEWYDRQLRQDYYIIGCTIFCRGARSEVWQKWDVKGEVARHLDNYILANPLPTNIRIVLPRVGLYMRTRPNGAVVHTLGYEETVEIISDFGEWSLVKSSEGIRGWCMNKWLK
jgi:SH3 domain-containing protein